MADDKIERSRCERAHARFYREAWRSGGGAGAGPAFLRRTVHLGTQNPLDVYALNAWLARIVIRSREETEKWAVCREEGLLVDVLKDVARLSWFEKGPLLS